VPEVAVEVARAVLADAVGLVDWCLQHVGAALLGVRIVGIGVVNSDATQDWAA
jgi:hypothetical protein